MSDYNALPSVAMVKAVAEYANAVGRYGPNTPPTKSLRYKHEFLAGFSDFADALDRVKLNLGGSGIDTPAEPVAGPEGYYEKPTLRFAAHSLHEWFGCANGMHPYIQSIGEAANADGGTIHVYLVRKPMHHEKPVPETWEGFPVKSRVVGRIVIG